MSDLLSSPATPARTASRALRSAPPALLLLLPLLVSLFAAWSLAEGRGSSALLVLLLAALAVIGLSIRPDAVLLGWLFMAPFIQNSARHTNLGLVLSTVFYLLPPVILGLHLFTARQRGRGLRWFDVLPAGYVAIVLVWQGIDSPGRLIDLDANQALYFSIGIGIVVYYVIAFGPFEGLTDRAVATALLASGLVMATMTLYESVTGWTLWGDTHWHLASPPRMVATLANPAVLGMFLGAAIAVATAILAWDGPRGLRGPSLLMIVLGVPSLILTYTRGPILATGIVAAAILLTRKSARLVAVALALIGSAALVGSWDGLRTSAVFENRFAERGNVEHRAVLGEWTLSVAAERPVFGWGYGKFDELKQRLDLRPSQLSPGQLVYTSHNTFGTVLVELGGVGLFLLVMPWVIVAWKSIGKARSRAIEVWPVAGLLGVVAIYVLGALTIDVRFFSFVAALPWVAVGVLRRRLSEG